MILRAVTLHNDAGTEALAVPVVGASLRLRMSRPGCRPGRASLRGALRLRATASRVESRGSLLRTASRLASCRSPAAGRVAAFLP